MIQINFFVHELVCASKTRRALISSNHSKLESTSFSIFSESIPLVFSACAFVQKRQKIAKGLYRNSSFHFKIFFNYFHSSCLISQVLETQELSCQFDSIFYTEVIVKKVVCFTSANHTASKLEGVFLIQKTSEEPL